MMQISNQDIWGRKEHPAAVLRTTFWRIAAGSGTMGSQMLHSPCTLCIYMIQSNYYFIREAFFWSFMSITRYSLLWQVF